MININWHFVKELRRSEKFVLAATLLNHFSFWPSLTIDPESSSGIELAMFSGILLIGYSLVAMREQMIDFVRSNRSLLWPIAWLAYGSLLALFNTSQPVLILLKIGYLTSVMGGMIGVMYLVRSRQLRLKKILDGWVVLACCIALVTIGQFALVSFGVHSVIRPMYDIGVFQFPRVHGFAFEPLFLANWLLVPLLYSVDRVRSTFSPRFMALTTLMATVFFLTLSRGAFIGLALGLSVLLLANYRTFIKTAYRFGVALLPGFVAALLLVGGSAALQGSSARKSMVRYLDHTTLGFFNTEGAQNAEKIKQANQATPSKDTKPAVVLDTEGVVEDSTKGRVSAVRTGIDIYTRDATTVIFGIGLFRYGEEAHALDPSHYPTTKEFTNNQVLDIVMDTGLVGIVLLTAFAYANRSSFRRTGTFWKASLTGLAAQFTTFSGYFLLPFWLVVACIIAVKEPTKHTDEHPPEHTHD